MLLSSPPSISPPNMKQTFKSNSILFLYSTAPRNAIRAPFTSPMPLRMEYYNRMEYMYGTMTHINENKKY